MAALREINGAVGNDVERGHCLGDRCGKLITADDKDHAMCNACWDDVFCGRKRAMTPPAGDPPAKMQRVQLPMDYVTAVLRGIMASSAPALSVAMKEGPGCAADSSIASLAHAARVAHEALRVLESADPASTAVPPRRALRVCFECEEWGCPAHESDDEEEEAAIARTAAPRPPCASIGTSIRVKL